MGQCFKSSPFGTCSVRSDAAAQSPRSNGWKSSGKSRSARKPRTKPSGRPSHPDTRSATKNAASVDAQVPLAHDLPGDAQSSRPPRMTSDSSQENTRERTERSSHSDSNKFWFGVDYSSSEGTSSPWNGSEIDTFSRPSTPPLVPRRTLSVENAGNHPVTHDTKEEFARQHKIPEGYSLEEWDPNEAPILLLGSVFDCNSLGKWIYVWTGHHHGTTSPPSKLAVELWLLLTQLANNIKRAEKNIRGVDDSNERELVRDFLEAGDRVVYRLYKLLKKCERRVLKDVGKSGSWRGKKAAIAFVETLFGCEWQLKRTERFVESLRLFNKRYEVNCGDILWAAERLVKLSSPECKSPSCSEENTSLSESASETQSSEGTESSTGSPHSTTTSIDTESTVFSDTLEEEESDPSNPFHGEIRALTKLALSDFEIWMEDPQDDEKGTGTVSRTTGSGKGSSGMSRRRPRSQNGRAGRGLDDDPTDGSKRRKSGGDNADEDNEGLCLACPYYKLDRFKHHDCLKYRLKRIKDVKQHLFRIHKQAHYCPSCGLEFDTQTQQVEHSRVQQCRIRDYPRPEGITHDQREELSSRVARKLATGEQWFTVWDIVFPGRRRPESPYVETQINEMLSNFRGFWRERGPEIVTDHLRSRRELSYSLANEERSLAAVHASAMHEAMGVLIDRFPESYAASTSLAREASDDGSESVSGNPSAETTSTDEGVADVRSAAEDVAEGQVSPASVIPPSISLEENGRGFALRGQLVPPAGGHDYLTVPGDQQDWENTVGFDVGAWAADMTVPFGFFPGEDLI